MVILYYDVAAGCMYTSLLYASPKNKTLHVFKIKTMSLMDILYLFMWRHRP